MTVPPVRGPIAVTGASGFIGRRLVARLKSHGADVRLWSHRDVDLLDADAVQRAVRRDAPKTVFHLACSGVSSASAHDPEVIHADLRMMELLVTSLRQRTRLIYAGSMAEYGRAGVLAETDRCTPSTAYAIGKLAAGSFGAAYSGRRRIAFCNARLFGVYGPGEAPQRLFQVLLRSLQKCEPVPLSDGRQRRDFIHVDDACETLIALAKLPEPPLVVNVGTGKAVSVGDVARWMADAVGVSRDLLRFGERPRSAGDENLLQADVRLLARLIGAAPPQRLQPGFSLRLIQD